MKRPWHHFAQAHSIIDRLVVFALVLALAGCGGGSSSSSGNGSGSGGGGSSTVASISIAPTSASLSVGATEQFTATAKDSSGSAISGVTFTWSSSSASVATVTSSGVATAVAAGTTNITASASGVTSSAATMTVVPALSVTTTTLPAGTVGTAYSATLNASGGTSPYTWSVSSGSLPAWATIDASTGVISGTPTAAGTTNFTVQVSDSESPAATATAALSIAVSAVSTGGTASLSGQYAFMTSGYDAALAGSVTLDGKGNVTGGEEDIRAPMTSLSGAAIAISSGTYTVGSDNRGTLTYKDANGNTFTFAFALGGFNGAVASFGQMIEFDSNPLELTGSLALQSSADFTASALSGGYAFESWGWDTTPSPDVTVGSFVVSGGAITSGLFDQNDNGTVNGAVAFTGAIGTIDSNGRATVSLGNGSKTDVYVISNSAMYGISDASDTNVQSGLMLAQSGGPYSASSMVGNSIYESRSENGVPAPHTTLGLIAFASGGTFTGTVDTNDSGTLSLSQSAPGSWSLASASAGRILFTPTGEHTAVGYLIAPGEAFITTETSVTPDVGTIELQTGGPFTNASLSGTYVFGTLPGLSPPDTGSGIASNISSGVFALDGAGNMSGTLDNNSSGVTSAAVPDTDTYAVSSDGRATLGSASAVVWIVSPTKAYAMQISQGQPGSDNPAIFVLQR
jgi:Putative Ig domain/Bacterial Ig-like domain (group 2)